MEESEQAGFGGASAAHCREVNVVYFSLIVIKTHFILQKVRLRDLFFHHFYFSCMFPFKENVSFKKNQNRDKYLILCGSYSFLFSFFFVSFFGSA